MSVARVTEISALSPESFEAAIREGIDRAGRSLRGVRSAWIKDMNVVLDESGGISGFQVNMAVTFILEEAGAATEGDTATAQTDDVPMGTTTGDTAPGTTVASDIPPGGSGGGVPPDTSRTEGEPTREGPVGLGI